MKLNGTFTLREVAGEILVIPVGKTALSLNGMIVLNPVSKVIWQCLGKGAEYHEILRAVTDTFEVSMEEAAADLNEFLNELRKQKLLSE
jgi:chromosome condensin MukBEF complex kleisin-like MukF subunit